MKMLPPKYITKYFKHGDHKYFVIGQIRFGTLRNYREAEQSMMGARLDQKEGVHEQEFTFAVSHVPEFNIGGIRMRDCGFIGNNGPLTVTTSANEFVFCASVGPYSLKQHRKILFGDENGYSGNPDLTCFAVFETEKLIAAIDRRVGKSTKPQSHLPPGKCVHGFMAYDKDLIKTTVDNARLSNNTAMHSAELMKTLFSKPSLFSAENEYRLYIRPDQHLEAPRDSKELLVKSMGIRRSIVEFGEWGKKRNPKSFRKQET